MRYFDIFLAEQGKYEACGMFNFKHLILIILTCIGVWNALKKTSQKSKDEIQKKIKKCTIVLWIFEIFRIGFRLFRGGASHPESYLPLYYCSLLLYSGIFSSFTKGKLKKTGDIFLATGGIIGGVIFLLFPSTSLPSYPMMHFMSLHSFLYHGVMVYLGILLNITNYIEYNKNDVRYYARLVGTMCLVVLFVNHFAGSNLMFISEQFPGVLGEVANALFGRLYTPIMVAIHMFLPFYAVCAVKDFMIKRILFLLSGDSKLYKITR